MTVLDCLSGMGGIESKLKKDTNEYWEAFKGNTQGDGERWQWYLETAVSGTNCSLFECEMAYAAKEKRLPVIEDGKEITLVILVGESFEPLLQSVWAHNPARLVPVVNKAYPGNFSGFDQWNEIRVPLQMLLKRGPRHTEWQLKAVPTVQFEAPKDKKDCFAPVVDEPTAVFEFLQKHLKDDLKCPNRRVIVDITGAKKTMVAGAFMMAAYSDTEICYVDSKQHGTDKFNGRPYGYACEFRKVENPLKTLALQSWNNIEKLYNKGDYAHAVAILNAAYPKDREKEDEGQEKQEYLEKIWFFETYLQICAHWDEGDIAAAGKLLSGLSEGLQEHIPFAVRELKELFPKTDDATLNIDLFSQTDKIVIYAQDEIERVKRLIQKGASRAAFSRAYALYEALFNFRVTLLFKEHALFVKPVKNLDGEAGFSNNKDITWHNDALIACTNMFSSKAIKLLRGDKRPQSIFWFDPEVDPKTGKSSMVYRNATIEWPNPRQVDLKYIAKNLEPNDELKGKRNLITHSYFPAKKEYAEAALRQAEQNFAEYKKNWVKFPDKAVDMSGLDEPERYSVPPWETIREAFGLHFIPIEKV